jgi:hypothetical protein
MSGAGRTASRIAAGLVLLLAACGTTHGPSPSNAVEVHPSTTRWEVQQGARATLEVEVHVFGEAPPQLDLTAPAEIQFITSRPDASSDKWIVEVRPGWDLTPGTYGLVLIARAGVASATTPVDLVITAAPGVTLHLIGPSEAWANASLDLTVSTEGPGATTVELLADSNVLTMFEANFPQIVPLSSLAEGDHAITAQVRRGAQTFRAPETLSVHVDRTAPTLLKLVPDPDDANVPLAAQLEVWFSEPVLITTISGGVTSVPPGLSLANVRTRFLGGRRLEADLVGATREMMANITLQGITDRAGNPAAPISFGWSYPFWRVLEEGLNPKTGGKTEMARLLATPSGRAFVGQAGKEGTPTWMFLRVLRLDGDGSWEDLSWNYASASSVDLWVDASDVPTVAADALVYRYDGMFWDALPASLNCGSTAMRPILSVLGLGHRGSLAVSCTWDEPSGTNIRAYEYGEEEQSWTHLGEALSSELRGDIQPLGVGASTDLTLFPWYDHGTIGWSAWDGNTWSSPVPSVGGLNWERHRIAWVDSGGVPFISATATSTNGLRQLVLLKLSGGLWEDLGTPLRNSVLSVSETGPVALGEDPNGKLHALWVATKASGSELRVAGWNGTSWAAVGPAVATLPTGESFTDPAIAFTGADVYLLWTSRPDGQLHARKLNR